MKIYKCTSGLQTHIGIGQTTSKRCPPKLHDLERTSNPYAHRGKGRQNLLRLKT